jgi:hypothetical protein
MGLVVNSVNQGQPYIEGKLHNGYLNGKKVWVKNKWKDKTGFFVGGYLTNGAAKNYSPYYYYRNVDAYSPTLERTVMPDLPFPTDFYGTQLNNKAIFLTHYYGTAVNEQGVEYWLGRGTFECFVYDNTGVRTTVTTALSTTSIEDNTSGKANSKYIIFFGYQLVGNYNVYGLDKDFVTFSLPSQLGYHFEGVTVEWQDYLLNCGGYRANHNSASNLVEAYSPEGTVAYLTSLRSARRWQSAATTTKHVIIAGGYSASAVVDAYDANFTRIDSAANLQQPKSGSNAASTGDKQHVVVRGGQATNKRYNDTGYTTVDIYDTTLTHTIGTPYPVPAHAVASITLGDYAVFAGGSLANYVVTDKVVAYASDLTQVIATPLSVGRRVYRGSAKVFK